MRQDNCKLEIDPASMQTSNQARTDLSNDKLVSPNGYGDRWTRSQGTMVKLSGLTSFEGDPK
jgi:hypothetical protein